MLGKLFKYDFKWINKVLCVHFIVLVLLSIGVKIVESMEQTLILVIIDKILSSMFIGCIVSIVITCVMRIWSRFITNVYKDESYLTHTLPITKNQIFNAKVLSGIVSLTISGLVILACVAFVFLNENSIEDIKLMYQSLVDVYSGAFAVCFVIGMGLLILLEVIYFMMAGLFGIVIGYRFNNYKTIIVGIASYGALSTVSFIVLGIMSKIADFTIVSNGFPALSTIRTIGITFIFVYLVYCLIYYFSSKIIFNKGVNVE